MVLSKMYLVREPGREFLREAKESAMATVKSVVSELSLLVVVQIRPWKKPWMLMPKG